MLASRLLTAGAMVKPGPGYARCLVYERCHVYLCSTRCESDGQIYIPHIRGELVTLSLTVEGQNLVIERDIDIIVLPAANISQSNKDDAGE